MKYNRLLCYIILGIWTLSLLQFTLVLTATRARRDQVGAPSAFDDDEIKSGCCNPEIYGIIISIMMQDCPFLVVRLLLIFKYAVVSYTNMFFTSKNSLVIILLLYRVIVVQAEGRSRKRKLEGSPGLQRLRMYDNNHMVPRGIHDGRLRLVTSNSSPSVYKPTDSLGRNKNHAVRDRRSDPTDNLCV